MSIDKDQREDPESVSYDPDKEQRELEAAGWEREDRQGKLFWKNPQSGHLYPQGTAVKRLRAIASEEDSEGES
jgi:ABC-type transport system substrate-binding protein